MCQDYGMKMIQAEKCGQTDEMKSSYWASARDQIKDLLLISQFSSSLRKHASL